MNFKVYRIYYVYDKYVKCTFLYNGNLEDCNDFVENYIVKLDKIFISPYYDRIYIVKNENELDYSKDYIDIRQKNNYSIINCFKFIKWI